MADPEILKINVGFVLRKKSSRKRTRLPAEVIGLLTPEAQAKHLAETDDPMEVDDDPVQAGPDGVADVDEGLEDIVFVITDEEGGEQFLNLQNEAMDVDIALNNINAAGDVNVPGHQA